ncbi:MAG: acyl-CoA thioesterase [Gemmatimonadetes bacterium]|nr:acyl-CoA thioesterase [Gemmatimonadota bacterium]
MAEGARGLLDGYPVTVTIPVAWGEMDAFRHVNNIVYFRYFETARIEYLRRIGFGGERDEDGIGPIMANTHCRFRRPLTFPDTVTVGARVTEVGEDRFTMEYRLVSHALNDVAAEGGGVLVAYDYRALGKAPLPQAVREGIARMERSRAA